MKIEPTTDKTQIVNIMKKCDICILALFDEPFPYIVPINFGVMQKGEKVIMYFNSKRKGKKDQLIANNPKASFEMDCCHEVFEGQSFCETYVGFESVVGNGTITELTDVPEKKIALQTLSEQLEPGTTFEFPKDCSEEAIIYKMEVDNISGLKKK